MRLVLASCRAHRRTRFVLDVPLQGSRALQRLLALKINHQHVHRHSCQLLYPVLECQAEDCQLIMLAHHEVAVAGARCARAALQPNDERLLEDAHVVAPLARLQHPAQCLHTERLPSCVVESTVPV